jgi:predicted dehydrogenase
VSARRVRRGGTLGVGIVGCGFVTESRHLPALARVRELRVEAIADVSPGARSRVAARFGIRRTYADAAELVADPAVDLVAVCVPAAAHAELALAALAAGRHVLVEKPLALSLGEADRLVDAAAAAAGVALVGFNLRWHRLVRQARQALAAGALGRVTAVVSTFTDSRAAEPDLPAWRTRRELGGGALLDKGIHHLDLWRFLLGEELDEVFASSRSGAGDDETVVVSARLGSGAVATLVASDRTAVANELRLYGDAGSLVLDCYRSDGLALARRDELPGAPGTRLRRLAGSLAGLVGHADEIRRGGVFDASYEAQWRHIARAAAGLEPPGCTFEDGRRTLAAAIAAERSAELGEPVAVAGAPSGASAA